MQKSPSRLLALATISALAISLAAAVAPVENHAVESPLMQTLGIRELALSRLTERAPVPLPMPVEPMPAAGLSGEKLGPVAPVDGVGSIATGSALVRPRGGAMYTARQRADQQIRTLIRRLD